MGGTCHGVWRPEDGPSQAARRPVWGSVRLGAAEVCFTRMSALARTRLDSRRTSWVDLLQPAFEVEALR